MNNQSEHPSFWETNRVMIKSLSIGALILIMLIPIAFISQLVDERSQRQTEVIKEVSSKWAGAQTITGPILMIPYYETTQAQNNENITVKKFAYFRPEELGINGEVVPVNRHRIIYDVALFRSNLKLTGKFGALGAEMLKKQDSALRLDEAYIALGISDLKGIEEEIKIKWNDQVLKFQAGLPENPVIASGLIAPISLDPNQPVDFSFDIKLKGSEQLFFTPVGQTTRVGLQSTWKNPSFAGNFIPNDQPLVNDKGFKANWDILQTSLLYPVFWKDTKIDFEPLVFGVRLFQPNDLYAKTDKSIKYSLLFIGLTFGVFFLTEIIRKMMVHPLQYLLVGLALCIFYTLLLSISEYTGFNIAYFIALVATVVLIGFYLMSIFKKKNIAWGFALALMGLYSYIFILIQLQDYALLFGSIGLFAILAAIMYFSRKIDWYAIRR